MRKSSILLSIIIPAFNAEDTIEATLDSLLAQTLSDFEVIIVDDGSTDNTPRIVDNYALIDHRIKAIHTVNGGQSCARNTGLDAASGNLIAFLDADDLIEIPDLLEHYVNLMRENLDVDIVQFPTFWRDSSPKIKNAFNITLSEPSQINNAFLKREFTGTVWDKIYRCSLFDKVKFVPGRYFEDTWFIMDLIPHIRKIRFDDYGYYSYIYREGSEMNSHYNALKWCHRIERNLRFFDFFSDDSKSSRLYMDHYFILLKIFAEASIEHPTENFDKYHQKIMALKPSILSLVRSGGRLNQLLKLLILNTIGFKTLVSIYKKGQRPI